MMEEIPLFKMATAMARHATARHRVIAENVANADTPEFRARDVRSFSEYVNEPFTAKATRPGHLGFQPIERAARRPEVIIDPAADSTSGNGNSVSLEDEMMKANEARGQHAMAQAIYRKAHDLMRLGLGRGR
ncbi:MAG: FlgB family protein [Pseudomonadota bacterium]